MTKCHCCDGSGQEVDDAYTGNQMRQLRQRAKISQKAMADKLGISGAYLCDLEHGYRHWNIPMTQAFREECRKRLAN